MIPIMIVNMIMVMIMITITITITIKIKIKIKIKIMIMITITILWYLSLFYSGLSIGCIDCFSDVSKSNRRRKALHPPQSGRQKQRDDSSLSCRPSWLLLRVYDHDRLFRMCFLEFQLLRTRFETSLLNLDILTGTWLKWDFWRTWQQLSSAGCFLDPWNLAQQTTKKSIFFETNKLIRLKWSALLSTNN